MEDNNVNAAPQSESSAGPIIGAIIILAVVLFGFLFFWGERGDNQALENQVNSIESQSNSDETADIEADLESTEIDNLDAELNAS